MICPGKTSETHYNKLASLNLEDYVLVSINFEYKLHPVDYLFVGNSRRMKEIRKDLYKKLLHHLMFHQVMYLQKLIIRLY